MTSSLILRLRSRHNRAILLKSVHYKKCALFNFFAQQIFNIFQLIYRLTSTGNSLKLPQNIVVYIDFIYGGLIAGISSKNPRSLQKQTSLIHKLCFGLVQIVLDWTQKVFLLLKHIRHMSKTFWTSPKNLNRSKIVLYLQKNKALNFWYYHYLTMCIVRFL